MAPPWKVEVDLVVFGCAAAGPTAALVAAQEGLGPLLCEKAPVLGGTSARLGRTVWIPGSKVAQQAAMDAAHRSVASGAASTKLSAEL